jgi:DNA mismatch repair protein MutL
MSSNRIKIMPQALANRIAAGEVVNRPDSVVKELIENSIDAGATEITLIIKDSGKTLIQVIDNGTGMNQEDAELSFERHSSSKVFTFEDLDNIRTLGFRGEALASIASISQVELKTKTADDELGTLINIEGNLTTDISKINSEKGTSIAVKNLFYNTPGRRNFLKSNPTEFKHIYETFIRLAISNPHMSFQFFNSEDKILDLRPSDLLNRISDIFPSLSGNSLVKIEGGNNIIQLNGFISKPGFTKKAKQDQYFYLNGRFFSNKNLNFAVFSSYEHLVAKGDYPSFFLFIDTDPHKVDVNVHPSKMEVKFEDEGAVFGLIRHTLKNALGKAEIHFDLGFENSLNLPGEPEKFYHKPGSSFDNGSDIKSGFRREDNYEYSTKGFSYDSERKPKIANIIPLSEEKPQAKIFEHTSKTESEGFEVWQFHNKYIICNTETGLMIIDQHAAHERILYEKAVLILESHSSFSQQLLIPLKLKLSNLDYNIAINLKNELYDLGFNFKELGDDFIELFGVPSDVKIGDENKILTELIEQYKEYELKLKLENRDNLAKSFACRSAIKSGDKLSNKEMLTLIDNLFNTNMPYVCPHGRPTLIRITTEELDKRFSR